jgi:hypothetical protein
MTTSQRRSVRSRAILIAATAAVLAAVGATAAAETTHGATGHTTHATAATNAVRQTAAPVRPTAPPDTTAPPSTPPSAAPKPDPVATTAQPTPTGSTAPAAVLAAKLPDAAAERWQPTGQSHLQAPDGHDIGLNECATVDGALTWKQQGFVNAAQSSPAIQDTFTFADQAAAHAAYQQVLVGMDSCRTQLRALEARAQVTVNAQVTRTASIADGTSWSRNWYGVTGESMGGPQINHLYVVQRGAELTAVQFTEFPGGSTTPPFDVSADPRILTSLDQQLGG